MVDAWPLIQVLHDHQIVADDDLALEGLRGIGAPGVVGDAEGRHEMRQHEGLHAGACEEQAVGEPATAGVQ